MDRGTLLLIIALLTAQLNAFGQASNAPETAESDEATEVETE